MTYSENRAALIVRIKANRQQCELALSPFLGIEDFYIFDDLLSGEKFIIHKKEIDE
jgi:hypothetical protein